LDQTQEWSLLSPGSASSQPGDGGEAPALTFAGFRLEGDGSLLRGESLIHLPPRELAALRLLLVNAGQIVTPSQLKRALWGDVHVTADSVPKCLSSLRARLQPDNSIQTVYKRGYRLLAEVRPYHDSSADVLPRLAIAPFSSEVGVPKHLGTAVAEETIARLCNAQRPLAVLLARDSVFTLALRGLTAQQIGASLHADLVLAGTLRSFASHFRLRMEMIRVVDGVQIWVEDLLVERDKIAGLESDLASRLDFRLRSTEFDSWQRSTLPSRRAGGDSESGRDASAQVLLRPAVERRAGGAGRRSSPDRRMAPRRNAHGLRGTAAAISPPDWTVESHTISAVAEPAFEDAFNPLRREAYEVYLRGHDEWQSMERHRQRDGLQLILRAMELDPSLIAAKVDLLHLCVNQALYGYMPSGQAAELVHQAVDSIPDFPSRAEEALPALAWINFHCDRDLSAALRSYELCAHLPHGRWTTRSRAMFALSRNRFDEAIALLRAAIKLDPFSSSIHSCLAWALHLDGQAAASVEQIEQTIRLFPDFGVARFYGATIIGFNGDTARAVDLAEELIQQQPYFDPASAVHAYALALAGRSAEARTILERLQWLGRERFVLRAFSPAAWVALGDLDAALSELRAANEVHCSWFFQALADPRLKPLHGHPEFEELRAILPRMESDALQEDEAQPDAALQI
jgi:DNA-binding winged helix-turn-helix (wHTH) protein/tetratricopeptide (TPR) repeat protein